MAVAAVRGDLGIRTLVLAFRELSAVFSPDSSHRFYTYQGALNSDPPAVAAALEAWADEQERKEAQP